MDNGFVRVGALFQIASVNNGVTPIVLPTNNLSGIIIRTCILVINSPAGFGGIGNLVADTVAPATASSGRVIAFAAAPANSVISQTIPYEIFVPPGLGLWWATSAALVTSSAVLTYDLVQPA